MCSLSCTEAVSTSGHNLHKTEQFNQKQKSIACILSIHFSVQTTQKRKTDFETLKWYRRSICFRTVKNNKMEYEALTFTNFTAISMEINKNDQKL